MEVFILITKLGKKQKDERQKGQKIFEVGVKPACVLCISKIACAADWLTCISVEKFL